MLKTVWCHDQSYFDLKAQRNAFPIAKTLARTNMTQSRKCWGW